MLLQLAAFVLAVPAHAAPSHAAPTHIAAELVAESPAAPGGTVTLAIVMKPAAGWHGYWSNPGDAGLGMEADWSLGAAKAKVGALQYPVPQTLLISGLMNHVYEHDYALLAPLKVPAGAHPGDHLSVSANAHWLACTEEICVPEQGVLKADVLVVAPGTAIHRDQRFDTWRAALPAPLGSQARFVIDGKLIRIGIPLPQTVALESPHLFPAEDHVIAYAAPQDMRRQGDLLVITLQRPQSAAADPKALSGVLRLNAAGDGLAFTAQPGAVAAGGDPVAMGTAGRATTLPLLLLAALAGGLLLNVMPCVFPILSLKALALARAGGSEAEARAEGLAYTGGVVLATSLLGGALLALRAAGQEVGWAFQLQEPGVVVALMLLALAITANLAGLFEFSVPGFARSGSPQGAFATGLLAAFAATPCTGPFMAAAMGAALLLPVAEGMALFVTLGIGLALPFLAVAYIPALRRLLPRPGKWMVWFKKLMALPMGLTALALLWLCTRLGGWSFAIAAALIGLGMIAALVAAGRRQSAGKAAGRQFALVAAPLALLAALLLPHFYSAPLRGAIESILPSQPFSVEALAKARASGKPVFVYFTADWCLTCKVNESAAIEREETRAAFAKAGVQVLVGDWTRRDPAITRFLTAHGAAGVPLYLWYAPGAASPDQLPQVLSAGLLAEKAGHAAASSAH
ncbi:MAG: protein-disulfide reductase DsbD domain-containing protein [Novosphingobium sp.]